MRVSVATHLAGAALFLGAGGWALQQQAGYVAASWICGPAVTKPVWGLALVALLLVLAGGWLTWRVLAPARHGVEDSDIWRPRRFLGLVSVLVALLFLFAILLQAAAAIFLPGCVG